VIVPSASIRAVLEQTGVPLFSIKCPGVQPRVLDGAGRQCSHIGEQSQVFLIQLSLSGVERLDDTDDLVTNTDGNGHEGTGAESRRPVYPVVKAGILPGGGHQRRLSALGDPASDPLTGPEPHADHLVCSCADGDAEHEVA